MLLVRIFVVFVLLYLAGLAALFLLQRKVLYQPFHTYVTPRDAGADAAFAEFPVTTADGLALKGWYAPAAAGHLTIVYFHGNGDGLWTVAPLAPPYIRAGYGFLIAEYRGYSGMPGAPTEPGLYADARAYMNGLIALGVDPKNIILMGYSLGSGVATQMATEFPVGGMVLLAPFLSVGKVAQVRFPIFPADYLTRDRYESFRRIPNLHMPLLIANGGRDRVVPPSQGRALFEMANEPKQFYFSPDSTHVDLFDGDLYPVSLKWLADLAAGRVAP